MSSGEWVKCKPLSSEDKAKDGDGLAHIPGRPNLNRLKVMSKEEIKAIADLVTANIMGCTKEVLTSSEASRYTGISMSHLYKLTMRQEIPHYKPNGKLVYFNRQELEQWLQRNRIATVNEAREQAIANNGRAFNGR